MRFQDVGGVVHSDNQSARAIAKMSDSSKERTKNLDVKHHKTRELVRDKHIYSTYVPTEDMVADIFTKALGKRKFDKFRHELKVRLLPDTHQLPDISPPSKLRRSVGNSIRTSGGHVKKHVSFARLGSDISDTEI